LEGTHGEEKEERLTKRLLFRGLAKWLLFGAVGYWIVLFIYVVFYRVILYDMLLWGVAWTAIAALVLMTSKKKE